jgi:transcriptional regulator with XRE-family HTH domain
MIAQAIKELRKKHKISQEELAKLAGITYSTLIKIESGVNDNPTIKTMKKIADALKVSLDKLAGRK